MSRDSHALTMKGHPMISRRTAVTGLAFCAALVALPAWAKPKSVLAMIDTDNDGTIDLAEAKKAASALFDRLDPDRDGTLDRRELRGRLSAKELAVADPDKDGTLTKDEYLSVVEQRFKAADPDNDGTLDAKELRSKAGKALLRLMI
jgi:Ca2+-binding EF-hand superfamily protein